MENNKEIVREELYQTIDRFYKEYPYLPAMGVTSSELNSLLNVVEAHFLANNMMDKYNHAINIIIRRALYYSTTDNRNAFVINHIAMALNDLSAFNITNDEIKAMQSELFEKVVQKIK